MNSNLMMKWGGNIMAENDGRIHNDDELYQALYVLRKLNEEQDNDDVQRQKELQETEDWYESNKKTRNEKIEWQTSRINDYAVNQLEEDPHWKYTSRNGTVKTRKVTTWKHDDDKLIKTVPKDFIKTVQKIKWGDYKKTLTATNDGRAVNENGEVVDGVTTTSERKTYITPTK